jgi:hypothetical protein
MVFEYLKVAAIGLGFITLSGCGSEKAAELATEPMPSPTGYYIMAKDIWRSQPLDICRQKKPDFVTELVGRLDRAMRVAEVGSVQNFDHFDAAQSMDGKGNMEAALWVNAIYKGKPGTVVVAIGDFDPATCKVGPMKAGAGSDSVLDAKFRNIPVG